MNTEKVAIALQSTLQHLDLQVDNLSRDEYKKLIFDLLYELGKRGKGLLEEDLDVC